MKYFTLYKDSGEIVSSGQCADDDFSLQLSDGLLIIEGYAVYGEMYVVNGSIVSMPTKPSLSGVFNYATKQWEDLRTLQDHITETRKIRDSLLMACDWTQLPDVPYATQLAWAAYRQALRDVTDQEDQMNVVWPVKPI